MERATDYELMKYKLANDALGIGLWDLNNVSGDPIANNDPIVYSQELRQMLGFTDERDFPDILSSWAERIHPDDTEKVVSAIAAFLSDYTGKTPFDVEHRLMLKNGTYRHFRTFGTTLRNSEGVPLRVAGALMDIDERTHTQAKLERREKMLSALNEMAATFLSHETVNFNDVMSRGLKPLTDVAGVDIVAIYKLLDGKTKLGQIYLWRGETIPLKEELVVLPEIPPVLRWLDIVTKNGYYNANVNDMPEDEKDFLRPFNTKALFFVPIYVHGDFWGIVTLEDHIRYRYFDEDCLDLLQSAAHLCASAVIRREDADEKTRTQNQRNEALEKLERREKMLSALNEMAVVFLSHEAESFNDVMDRGLKPLTGLAGVDRVAIYRLLDGKSSLGQVYLWKGNTIPLEEELMVLPQIPSVLKWLEIVTANGRYNANIEEMAEYAAQFLRPIGVKAMFSVPIYIHGELWGIVTLEDHTRYRYFDEDSLDLLQSAAHLCASAVVRDEMERGIKKIEREIAETETTRVMLDSVPLGANFWNSDFCLIDCNQVAPTLFGLTDKKEYIEKFYSLSPEVQPDGRNSMEAVIEELKIAFNKEGHRHFEWMMQTKPGGELIPCEITLVRVKHREDYVVISYIRDLREQKKAEESNRSKDIFLAHMSHEIRTPMNAILGVSEIQLFNEHLPMEIKEGFIRIYESGSLLLSIINDILDFSKIDAGKMEIVPERYEVPSTINDTMQLNRLHNESKPIEFVLQMDENTPVELIGDELRIKQTLNNLLSNAFKYTDTGRVELSVSVAPGPDEETVTLVLRVSDTGQGMSKDQIGELFEEYSRFNMEVNRGTSGTGLGMNITKRLIEKMNGEIFVESETGKGSVFTVRLPQKTCGAAVCGADVVSRLQKFSFHNTSATRKTQIIHEHMPYGSVLIVDDIESNLYVAKGLMSPYALRIDTAKSGAEAIAKIKNAGEYDVVFMDHMMPKMDGIETTGRLRGMGYTNPIVALTANAVSGQAEMFLSNGFDGFISKPIDLRELDKSLTSFVRDKKPPEVVEAARRERRLAYTPADTQPNHWTHELETYFILDAESAIDTLNIFFATARTLNDADWESYVTTVHGIKSALANIGEAALADAALVLENAGNTRNHSLVTDSTPALIDGLQTLIKKFKPVNADGDVEMTDDDAVFLREKLLAIKAACKTFDKKAAKSALTDLKQRTWPYSTMSLLDEISLKLLHGEIKKVVAIIDRETV